ILVSCATPEREEIKDLEVPRMYVANFAQDSPVIDGKIDEVWDQAKYSEDYIDIEGRKTPLYPTQMKMLWDQEFLFILAKIEEPHVWGNLKQRDTVIFYNNDFEVFIDPDGDTHQYMELEINSLNTAWDLFLERPYRNKVKVDNAWNIEGLQSAVSYQGTLNDPSDNDLGWTLEIALPWKALERGNASGIIPVNQFWRMNFSRVNWQFDLVNNKYVRKKDKNGKYLPEFNWVWSPQGVINMHVPERWGYVFFSDGTLNEINHPPDAPLIQWMYGHYRTFLAQAKKGLPKNETQTAQFHGKEIRMEKILCNDTLYWKTENPISKKSYLIRNDGKLEMSN
ncbi:carbohydrate-binding family 9-like protein, partial [Flavobacteriaceae bacterium]|nr:carbohydrate-binding family 9-like protein [Flavobacteriaceae bacterium]